MRWWAWLGLGWLVVALVALAYLALELRRAPAGRPDEVGDPDGPWWEQAAAEIRALPELPEESPPRDL